MKAVIIVFTGIILAVFFSCEPIVTFTEPQPMGAVNLPKFPKRLQGQYLSTKDSSTLVIDNSLILRIYDINQKFHPNQLSSDEMLSGDTLINQVTHEKTLVRTDGDSIVTSLHFIDTIFLIDDENVVRKLKGYYFLNTRYSKYGWEVRKLQLSKGQLIVSKITEQSDIDNLKTIAETVQDTARPYQFKATKKQFKRYVRNEGFSDQETFLR